MLKFDWNFLWTIIDLIIFFVLMKVFLFKPIKKTLDARKELVDKQFKDADDAQKQAEELKEKYQSELDSVENEKKQIISDARADAKIEYNKIVDKAQGEAEKIKASAKRAAEIETEKAKKAAKEQIAALAMEAAEKVVSEKVSAESDSRLYDEFLNESSDENDS